MRKRTSGLSLAAALVGAATLAATLVATGSGSQGAGGTIVFRIQSAWPTLDPYRYQSVGTNQLTMPAYDRLLGRGPGLKLVPYLATSWKATPKSVVFQLRKDARCSDGTRVTPDVVVGALKHMIEVPKVNNQIITYLGPGPFAFAGDAKKWTVTVRSGTPFRHLLGGFAHPLTSIMCPAGVAAVASNIEARAERMFGSGPYNLVSVTQGDQLVFKLRPEWKWGPGGVTAKDLVDTLILKVVVNPTTAANLLLTGGLDLAQITGPDAERLSADRSLIHKTAKGYNAHPLLYSMFPGRITTDDKVREALTTALDPKLWNTAANLGKGTVSPGLIVPGGDCYDKKLASLAKTANVDRARQILISDGWTLSGGILSKAGRPLRVTLLTSRPLMAGGGEYIAKQWRDMGVDVNLVDADSTTYSRNFVSSNFDATVSYVQVSIPDAGLRMGTYAGLAPPAGANFANSGVGDPTYHRWMRLAFSTDGKESCSWFFKVQQRMLQRHYLLPLAAPSLDIFSRGVDFIPTLEFLEPAYFRKK